MRTGGQRRHNRRRPSLITVATVFVLLAAAQGGLAWHWEDEEENVMFNTPAGDPRVLEDAEVCLNETQDLDDVSCVAVYPHVFDIMGWAPTNVQRPPDCLSDIARGTPPPVDASPLYEFNQLTLFSSPGFVEYEEVTGDEACGDNPRMAPRLGLGLDLLLADDVNITGFWYLSSDMIEQTAMGIGTGPDGEPSAGVMPCLSVEMTLETGRSPGEGRVIAQGITTKSVVSTPEALGDHPLGITDPCPGAQGEINAETVTEFRIDLGPAESDILAHEGYHVHVRWYQWDGVDPAPVESVSQSHWNLRTGPEHVNRVLLPVEATIQVKQIALHELDGTTYIQTLTHSTFGSYDADIKNMRLSLLDENGDPVALDHLDEPILRYSIDHDGQFYPVNATFPWDLQAEGLEPGEYTIEFKVPNWQHTQVAVAQHPLMIESEPEEAPAALALGLLIVSGLIVGLARKRR